MLINKTGNVAPFCPYIQTEEIVCRLLEKDRDQVSDEFELFYIPLAHLINTIGIPKTNTILNYMKSNRRRVFICQHVSVQSLAFRPDDIVFTPHASVNDCFIPIPHAPANVDRSLIREPKDLLFSFLGSTETHWTRKRLVEQYPSCRDSKQQWGLAKGLDKDFHRNYMELIGRSQFSLCPRGTGISSVRLFESMAMDSFPVIIADGYKRPLDSHIEWNRISVTLRESNLHNISSILEVAQLDCNYLRHAYENFLSPERLHMSALLTLASPASPRQR